MHVFDVPTYLLRHLGSNFREKGKATIANTSDPQLILVHYHYPQQVAVVSLEPAEHEQFVDTRLRRDQLFPKVGVVAYLEDTGCDSFGQGRKFREQLTISINITGSNHLHQSPVTARLIEEYFTVCRNSSLEADEYWELEKKEQLAG